MKIADLVYGLLKEVRVVGWALLLGGGRLAGINIRSFPLGALGLT